MPPAYTVDAKGRPLHSWRTLILPYLDEQALYDSIDLSKPWDDPTNADAHEASLFSFRCPASDIPDNHTTYVGVVGANSCLHPSRPRPFSEITDGTSETLMVIELSSDQSFHWMMPRDGGAEFLSRIGAGSELAHRGGTHRSQRPTQQTPNPRSRRCGNRMPSTGHWESAATG
ncbi:MAG TPA: DUF1559 domain-containing protein [Fuerstia sp.]|nr:DUF1559 domain-containing protein [Fuerstiella sp.]